MKKTTNKTVSKIKEALPELEIDGELESLADRLDELSVWRDFNNSPIGEKFSQELEALIAVGMGKVLNGHKVMKENVHFELAEMNALLTLVNRIKRSTKQYNDVQDQIDEELKTMIAITKSVSSRGANAGF